MYKAFLLFMWAGSHHRWTLVDPADLGEFTITTGASQSVRKFRQYIHAGPANRPGSVGRRSGHGLVLS